MGDIYKRLGELLLESGQISGLQLSIALAAQRTSTERLGQILVAKGFVTERQITRVLADQYGFPIANLETVATTAEARALIPYEQALRSLVLPVSVHGGILECVISDPIDVVATDRIAEVTGCKLKFSLAPASAITLWIHKEYGYGQSSAAPPTAATIGLDARYASVQNKPGFPEGVYDAIDRNLSRPVCLVKISKADAHFETFWEMVRDFSLGTDPTICPVFDFHCDDDEVAWLSTQRFYGESLEKLLESRGARSVAQTAAIATSVARATEGHCLVQGDFRWLSTANLAMAGKGDTRLVPISPTGAAKGPRSAIRAIGEIIGECLGLTFGSDLGNLKRQPHFNSIYAILQKCAADETDGGYESIAHLLSDLGSVNWSARVFSDSQNEKAIAGDRDSLLDNMGEWNGPSRVSLWQRLFGRRAA